MKFYEESWAPKNWCFWTVVLQKTLESPLDKKEIKPFSPKGNQPWIFIGSINAEAEAPILWPPDVKSWLTGKDPDAGKDWRREEKGEAEDKKVTWHQWTWVWANSGRWCRTRKPGVLQSMGLQRVRHNSTTKQRQMLFSTYTYARIILYHYQEILRRFKKLQRVKKP